MVLGESYKKEQTQPATRKAMVKLCHLPFAVATLLAIAPVRAHEDTLLQIENISGKIEQEGATAALLNRRGALHLQHQSWDEALADFRLALKSDPQLASAELGLAKCYLGKKDTESGLKIVDSFLLSSPENAEGLLVRARLNAENGDLRRASDDYRRSLRAIQNPEQGIAIYFEWAERLKQGGAEWHPEALKVLDEGIRGSGQTNALVETAIDIELTAGNFSGAVARIDRLLKDSPYGSPRWILRRAEILEAAGHCDKAIGNYKQTLDVVRKLPDRRRATAAAHMLESQATEGIRRLRERQNLAPTIP